MPKLGINSLLIPERAFVYNYHMLYGLSKLTTNFIESYFIVHTSPLFMFGRVNVFEKLKSWLLMHNQLCRQTVMRIWMENIRKPLLLLWTSKSIMARIKGMGGFFWKLS